MGDSDTENEKFVENVMHELQAFQVPGRPKLEDEQNHPTDRVDGSSKGEEPPEDSGKPPLAESKVPTRIIKLSRPSTQFSSSRAQATSQSETSVSASSNVNGVPSVTSAVSGTPTPGSRLAALQRPGSPFHKYLQRAQSPALAAAAKLSAQRSSSSATAGGKVSGDNAHEDSTKQEDGVNATQNGETHSADGDTVDNKALDHSNQTQGRSSIIPPRIQSSALTSSILLRRPQSPLHGSHGSYIPINRQVAGVASEDSDHAGPKSPKSPKSDGPISPGLRAADNITSADRVAIRNKLRANSFRLKDLLEKRPFVKSHEQDDNESKDDSATATRRLNESSRSTSLPVDNSGDAESLNKDRPRVSALLLRSRSRNSGDKPPPTLISARSLRTRNADKVNVDLKETNDGDKSKTDASIQEVNINRTIENEEKDTRINAVSKQESASSASNETEHDSLQNSSGSDITRISENNMTVGATLLRSPRTRISAPDSPVPLEDIFQQVPDTPKDPHNILNHASDNYEKSDDRNNNYENQTVDHNTANTVNAINQSHTDANTAKSKAISQLEKEAEPNLVFDSENIGQSEKVFSSDQDISLMKSDQDAVMSHSMTSSNQDLASKNDLKELQEARKCAKESFMSKSMTASSGTPRWRDWKQQRQRVGSEPVTSVTDSTEDYDKGRTLSVDEKSSDENKSVDMSRSSPALKRSLVVTDLDKAMIDRDQQKLSSIFKEGSLDTATEKEERKPTGVSKDLETDLDVLRAPTARVTRSAMIQQKMCKSLEDNRSPPTSPQPIYKPSVNLEDAVKWPMDLPGKLDFRKMEVFEGQMLLNWLTGSIDESHYLRLVMTKHDISVVACQICTCLIAAGVIKQLEAKDGESLFKPDCMYYWTHTQSVGSPRVIQDVNKLPHMWPPNLSDSPDKPGLKYTEADHQAAMVTLRHEYKDEVEKIQVEHQGVLDKARQEYQSRLQQAIERIAHLQKEVEKYRCLAGIEKLTQEALSDADAARIEAGLQSDETQSNGYSSPSSGTPSISQYHTPAVTPDCVSLDYPVNYERSPHELFNNVSTPHELRPDGDGIPPPPPAPPAPPQYPGAPPAPPPPAPPPLGGPLHRNLSIKPVVHPKSPMKPLFWQRIQVHEIKTPKHKEYLDKKLVWEDIKEEDVNIEELDEMFSKTALLSSKRFSPLKPKAKAKEVAKVIIPKRSQTIGILLSSLRLEMSEIEDAILKFDTSQLSEEKLRQIYENRGSDEEIKKLKDHIKKHPDVPLDKPDQFLYDLSLIPDYAERIFCFIFQQAFQESISVIETKMTNLRMTCRNLMSSVNVKRILGLVLALGNYMNGGNKSRGQADGFGLEILPKLKDVKSKDSMSSLLHYTVYQYIRKFEKNDSGTEKVSLPVPESSDMSQGMGVNFDELGKELDRIKKDFEAAEERAAKVVKSAKEPVYLQPFKDTMTEFFQKGRQEFHEQEDNLIEGKKIFQETVIFFCVKPKSGDKVVTPEYFFSLWAQFCQDFKYIWKREQQKLLKQRVKENELRVKRIQENLAKKPVRTRVRKAGGLKDRLAKQGLLDS